MNYTKYILLLCLLQPVLVFAQLGSSCGTPFIITLDGVKRTYAASSNTGGAVVCTNGNYPNTSPVTWFSLTTNASAEMPLLDITSADSSSCEIAMYTACNGGGILQTASSMCFDDGWGLWAPAHNYTLLANTTYLLRIKTSSATQISITAQNHTPTNNLCSGATPVGTIPVADNNACNRPSSEVIPSQLCAYTIENTAFYQFYVATTGLVIINIANISCDNGATNNGNGFQIGFFTGSCGSLTPLSCAAGEGTIVQATTPSLAANTKVYVAIDGEAGSNCRYTFQALNAFGVLAVEEFKNFSAWKTDRSNILKWTSSDVNSTYQIERSLNGSDFYSIGKVYTGTDLKEMNYHFEDNSPLQQSFYRVKRVSKNGQISMSNTIRVDRKDNKGFTLRLVNPVRNNLKMEVESKKSGIMHYAITSIYGQVYFKASTPISSGLNKLDKDVSRLPNGEYIITVLCDQNKTNYPFIKAD